MKKIICIHLYNDFSGSPLVLSTAIKGLIKKRNKVTILTSDSEGFLSNLSAEKITIPYQFQNNKFLRLLSLFYNQWLVFCCILKFRKEDVVIYVNTLLPFGAALAGRLIGKKVVYHVHETSIRPLLFKWFLKFIASITANQAIYVSKYLMDTERIQWTKGKVIYNALSSEFVAKANQFVAQDLKKTHPFTVLMLCSLKKYKGIDQFVEIARRLPNYRFELVLNATGEEINQYFNLPDLPPNLVLFPRQSDVHWFYERAHLVLNLSDPNAWVETFGMTLLEAMTYGIPVIAPAVGGPIEIVQHGFNGFSFNLNHLTKIMETIQNLAQNRLVHQRLSLNAINCTHAFKESSFLNAFNQAMQTNKKIQIQATNSISIFIKRL